MRINFIYECYFFFLTVQYHQQAVSGSDTDDDDHNHELERNKVVIVEQTSMVNLLGVLLFRINLSCESILFKNVFSLIRMFNITSKLFRDQTPMMMN